MDRSYRQGSLLSKYVSDKDLEELVSKRDLLAQYGKIFVDENRDMFDEDTLDEFPLLDYDPASGMSEEEYVEWQQKMELEEGDDDDLGEEESGGDDDLTLEKASDEYDMKLSVKAIILEDYDASNDEDDHRFLILKDSGSDWWDLPGGHVAEGETLADGLFREVMEETGLTITDSEELFTKTLTLGKETKPVIFYFVEMESDADLKLSEEHTDYEWITLDEAEDYNLGVFLDVIEEAFSILSEMELE